MTPEERDDAHSKQLNEIDTKLALILQRMEQGDGRIGRLEGVVYGDGNGIKGVVRRVDEIQSVVVRHQGLFNRVWVAIVAVVTAILSKLGYDFLG